MKLNPQDRVNAHMAAIRRYALTEFGKADDETCFRIATTFWCAEKQTGFHRTAQAEIPELRLDNLAPVQ